MSYIYDVHTSYVYISVQSVRVINLYRKGTMKVVTESGTEYSVQWREGRSFLHTEDNRSVIAAVSELREGLCRDALAGRREILKSKTPAGVKAIGFTGSEATLAPSPPRVGWRLFQMTTGGKPQRLSTKVVSVTA